jgi:CRISPR-associated protein Csb2
MALVLEIEHLLGIAFAAQGPDRSEPDWPPQPDRVFSALVAAWAARGEAPAERAALEWLERQDPLRLGASGANYRPAPISYVPTNDPASGQKGNKAVMPATRSRQPRRFPAALPDDPTVWLVWPSVDEAPLGVLDALARDVAYVGHSASLTRCRFLVADMPQATLAARRRIYPGRLRELETRFTAGRRPAAGHDVVQPQFKPAAASAWLVLQLTDERPDAERREDPTKLTIDLRAAPIACKALRDAIMSGYGQAGLAVPEWVCGHQPDGKPSRLSHLAIVPMAFAGYPNADGRLMGFGLIPPAGRVLLDDDDFCLAIRALLANERAELTLKLGRTGELRLTPSFDAKAASLRPARYCGTARRWTTLTPLVLDRHLKDGDGMVEMKEIVGRAGLRATGITTRGVVVHKHAAVEAAPSAAPSGRAPRWTGWNVPERLRSRHLVHATIEFEQEVTGPVLLGAGRFYGLGLCLPVPDAKP